jgi:hypothetical protein
MGELGVDKIWQTYILKGQTEEHTEGQTGVQRFDVISRHKVSRCKIAFPVEIPWCLG